MYRNIGKKIKFLAAVFAYAGALLSLLGGILYLTEILSDLTTMVKRLSIQFTADSFWELALLFFPMVGIIVAGTFLSWAFSAFLYGFGELIDRVSKIEDQLVHLSDSASAVMISREYEAEGDTTNWETFDESMQADPIGKWETGNGAPDDQSSSATS